MLFASESRFLELTELTVFGRKVLEKTSGTPVSVSQERFAKPGTYFFRLANFSQKTVFAVVVVLVVFILFELSTATSFSGDAVVSLYHV